MNFNDLYINIQTPPLPEDTILYRYLLNLHIFQMCSTRHIIWGNFGYKGSNYFFGLISQPTNVPMINHNKIFIIKKILLENIITLWNSGLRWWFSWSTDIICKTIFLSRVFVINTFTPLICHYHKKSPFFYFRSFLNLLDLCNGSFIWFLSHWLSFSLTSEWLLFSSTANKLELYFMYSDEQADAIHLGCLSFPTLFRWRPCLVKKSHLKSRFIIMTSSWHFILFISFLLNVAILSFIHDQLIKSYL